MARAGNTKKVVIFIVEGIAEKHALEKIFRTIYRQKNVVFKFTEGDITSDWNISKDNVTDAIYKIVNQYMQDHKLKKTDFWQIVQIFDMDGAYISDDAILHGENREIWYATDHISCKNVDSVIARNDRKRNMINYLYSIGDIKGIPYRTYFMSANLDHALYNQINLQQDDKEKYADAFYNLFQGREIKFIDFLKSDVVNGCPDNYPESWRYIKEGLHSLERHTNLHIYFTENYYLSA